MLLHSQMLPKRVATITFRKVWQWVLWDYWQGEWQNLLSCVIDIFIMYLCIPNGARQKNWFSIAPVNEDHANMACNVPTPCWQHHTTTQKAVSGGRPLGRVSYLKNGLDISKKEKVLKCTTEPLNYHTTQNSVNFE